MSKGNALLIVIIIVAIAGLGAWWYSSGPSGWSPSVQYGTEVPPTTTTLPSGTSITDTSLDQDLSAIDSQIGAFDSDNANVSAGLSDQQIEQSSL
ncbi:MAG: hypothetical protein Q8P36_00320 [bacterium]|nr:hypothetical protein [bacterium]